MQEQHKTYGVIRASRWTAGGLGRRLFGSHLPGHNSGVTLVIREGGYTFELGEGRVSGTGGKILCEVRMSTLQWAELITNMNNGDGVPCTVAHVLGDEGLRGDPPSVTTEPERVRAEYKAKSKEGVEKVKAGRALVAEKLKGKANAALAAELDRVLLGAQSELEGREGFYMERFMEATDRIVTSAKAEVDSVITSVITKLGGKALQDLNLKTLLGVIDPKDEG